MGKVAEFFGFGMKRADVDAQTIAELTEQVESLQDVADRVQELQDVFDSISYRSLPSGDDGWGFKAQDEGTDAALVAAQVRLMYLDWNRLHWRNKDLSKAVDRLREDLAEANSEITRLKAAAVLPVELSVDYVPQLAIEAPKPRVFESYVMIPEGAVAEDSDGDRYRIAAGEIQFRFGGTRDSWSKWYAHGTECDPDTYAPFTEVLPRVFQRGDVIPEGVTQLRTGDNRMVYRQADGRFSYRRVTFNGMGSGPSDTNAWNWEDHDFPLTEVLN